MKKLLAIAAAVAVVAMAGTAMAATGNLAVSANVTATCTITGGSLGFSALDPTTAPAVGPISSTGVSVTCTNGTAYTLTNNNGLHVSGSTLRLANGTDFIPYTLSVPAGGTGNGASQSVTIQGNIAAGTYATASAGSYTDTVQITVAP